MGKGDKRRPMRVRHEEYARNFERTFGKIPGPRLQEALDRAHKDFRAEREVEAPSHPDVLAPKRGVHVDLGVRADMGHP